MRRSALAGSDGTLNSYLQMSTFDGRSTGCDTSEVEPLAAHDRQSDAEEAPARSSPNLLMTSKLNLMQHA